jgi:hypothetical protein
MDGFVLNRDYTFRGLQERPGKPPLVLFDDGETGSTFAVDPLATAGQMCGECRGRFVQARERAAEQARAAANN